MANSNLRQINRITSTGTLSLFATLQGDASSEGLAFDSGGNLYVSRSNGEVHKITSSGTVSLFATLPPGSDPIGLAFDGIGNLYSADGNSEKINRITPGGAVSLFATLPFPEAWGLAFGTTGILYATDLSGDVHKIAPDGTVSLFASVAAESFLFLAVTDDAGHPLSLPPATLLGDYNRNGTVDAADYAVWRDGLGSVYNQNDYQIWRAAFRRNVRRRFKCQYEYRRPRAFIPSDLRGRAGLRHGCSMSQSIGALVQKHCVAMKETRSSSALGHMLSQVVLKTMVD